MQLTPKFLHSRVISYSKKIEEVNINLQYIHHSLTMLNEVDKPKYVCNNRFLWRDAPPPLTFNKQINQALNWAINKAISDFMSIVIKSITDTYYPALCNITKQTPQPFLKLELPELLAIMEDVLKEEVDGKEKILSAYQLYGYLINNKGIVYDNFVLKYNMLVCRLDDNGVVTKHTISEILKAVNPKGGALYYPVSIEKHFEKGKIINLSLEDVTNISLTCAWWITTLNIQLKRVKLEIELGRKLKRNH